MSGQHRPNLATSRRYWQWAVGCAHPTRVKGKIQAPNKGEIPNYKIQIKRAEEIAMSGQYRPNLATSRRYR